MDRVVRENKMAAPIIIPDVFRSLSEIINNSVNEENRKKLIKHVGSLKTSFQRQEACVADCEVLTKTFLLVNDFPDLDDKLDIIIELMGLLRNMCADCRHNQELVGKNDLFGIAFSCLEEELVEETKDVVESAIHQKRLKCLRIGVQFLGNLVVNNHENKGLVWNKVKIHFKCLLQSNDATLAQYTTMVLYNCLASMPHHVDSLLCDEADNGSVICKAVFQLLLDKETEWSLYIIELMLQSCFCLRRIYCNLSEEHRLLVLEICDNCLSQSKPSSHARDIAADNITFLTKRLKKQSDCILQTSQENLSKSLSPVEVLKTLAVLCSASSMDNYRRILQLDSSLLIVVIHLLKSIHMIGKSGDNTFTPIEKLSETTNCSSSISDNPAYGLKRDLVRLIGNLCWEHKPNQDMVRELDGISLLLDCSKMDARNPYITQWVVFAIHNLCDHNAENQALIASMQPMGGSSAMDSSELSAEMQNLEVKCNNSDEVDQSGSSHAEQDASSSIVHSSNTSTARERAISDIEDLFM